MNTRPLCRGSRRPTRATRSSTADPRYAFLDRLLAVGRGELGARGPVHLIDEVL